MSVAALQKDVLGLEAASLRLPVSNAAGRHRKMQGTKYQKSVSLIYQRHKRY
jgi:hypothetical protein